MPKTTYQCETCGRSFGTVEEALACEARGVSNQQPEIQIGMIVTANNHAWTSAGFGRDKCDWNILRTEEENNAHYGGKSHLHAHDTIDPIYVVVGRGPQARDPHRGTFHLVTLGERDAQRGQEVFVWNPGQGTHHRMYPLNPEDHPVVMAEVPRLLEAYRDKQAEVLL